MVSPSPEGKAAVREYVARLLDEHRALRQRMQELEEQIARLPSLVEEQNGEGASPGKAAREKRTPEAPLGTSMFGTMTIHGDIVEPTGEVWEAEQ